MRAPIMGVGLLLAGMAYLMRTVDNPPSETPPSRPGKVCVALLEPVSKVEGIDLPTEAMTERITFFQVKEPSLVMVSLPGGREVALSTKTAFVNINYGIVVDVDLLPLKRSVSYKEAVESLHRFMDIMDIEPDERMKERMATWPEDSAGYKPGFYPHTYRAEVGLSESATFLVKVRPASDGGWFLVFTFAADGPARRAARISAREAMKGPPADGADKE